MKIFACQIDIQDPCAAFAPLAALPYSLFLDSADRAYDGARYSYIVTQPVETIESKDGIVTITNAAQQTSFKADAFEIAQQRLNAWPFAEKLDGLPPFQGGAAGLFGYDLARQIENLPTIADGSNAPDMAIGIYDQVIAFDHAQNKAWIITHANDETEAEQKRRFILSCIESKAPVKNNNPAIAWQADVMPGAYQNKVQRVIDYILDGDIFQANLSQRFTANLPANFDAFAHYLSLRDVNPAPFAAFMNVGDTKIASASPERFLFVHNNKIETKPIKGTIRRSDNDDAQKQILAGSDKDRAENIMIVDLLRNDLSKVCTADSINVEKLCAVETFASVHHLVSTITGQFKENTSPLAALRACFPGGSISGAPKIRAMEIIEELESVRRGPYCGSIGYIGFDGCMDTNILIRTLIYTENTISFNVGGGITAASNPAAEYDETIAKAERIFASFENALAPQDQKKENRMILVIDNYDSFVHNLARHMELAGHETHIARNDKISLAAIMAMKPDAIVISPGPRAPQQAGICLDIIKNFEGTPILGICLGHQCIGEAYGMRVDRAEAPTHGRASNVTHNGDPLFKNVPTTFEAGRYHSLSVQTDDKSPLKILARTNDGEIMAVKHESFPVYGLQFHPESVLTPHGMQIIKNFSELALTHNARKLVA